MKTVVVFRDYCRRTIFFWFISLIELRSRGISSPKSVGCALWCPCWIWSTLWLWYLRWVFFWFSYPWRRWPTRYFSFLTIWSLSPCSRSCPMHTWSTRVPFWANPWVARTPPPRDLPNWTPRAVRTPCLSQSPRYLSFRFWIFGCSPNHANCPNCSIRYRRSIDLTVKYVSSASFHSGMIHFCSFSCPSINCSRQGTVLCAIRPNKQFLWGKSGRVKASNSPMEYSDLMSMEAMEFDVVIEKLIINCITAIT